MTEGGAAADEALASGAGNQAALRTGAMSIAVDSAVEAIPIGAVADVLIKRFKRSKRVGSEAAQAAAKNVDELSEAATKAVDDGVSIKGDGGAGKYSAFGEMSEVDGIRYSQWMKLREAGLDQAKINDIILTNKGLRPNPNTYLSETYINKHLKQFDRGVTKIMTQAPTGTAGPPGGTFVMPSSVADDLIDQAGGDISKLEKMLSLEPGTLGTSPVRIDVKNPNNLRVPSGNELGANSQWLPGGNTGGGIPEATITSPKQGEYIVKPIE